MKQGISGVILLQEETSQPQNDLADVLLQWQGSGIPIFAKEITSRELPFQIKVRRKSQLRRVMEDLLAALGFRPAGVGGFGSSIDTFTRAG